MMEPVNRVPQNIDELGGVAIAAECHVSSWTPERDGKGRAEQVHLRLRVRLADDLVLYPTLRLKSKRAVDELIAVLERHRNDVWP